MRIATKMAALGLLLGSSSCLSTVGPDTSKQTVAAVAGRVIRGDGTGVGGPLVTVQLLSEAVSGTAQLISSGSVLGADDGRFLFLFLINGFEPQTGSVNISVTAPIASGLLGKEVTGIPVKLVLGRTPTDTAYVEITLPAR